MPSSGTSRARAERLRGFVRGLHAQPSLQWHYYIDVSAIPASTCGGGLYRPLVTSPGGTTPTLVQDDITP
jgi:hypothetical protein